MKALKQIVARATVISSTLFLSACATYGVNSLQPGVSPLPEVIATMGMQR